MNSLKFRNFAEKRKMWKFKIIKLEELNIGNIENDKAIIYEIPAENIVEIFTPTSLGALECEKMCVSLLTTLGINFEVLTIDKISIQNTIKACEILDLKHVQQEYALNISDINLGLVTPIYTVFDKIKVDFDIQSEIHMTIPIYLALSKIILDYQQGNLKVTVKNPGDIVSFDGDLVYVTNNLKIYSYIYNADGCPIYPQIEDEKIRSIVNILSKEVVRMYGSVHMSNFNDNQAHIVLLIPAKLEDYTADSLGDLGSDSLFTLSFKEQN